MATITDPVLNRLRAALDEMYGDRIERVVLFGSRARGDAQPSTLASNLADPFFAQPQRNSAATTMLVQISFGSTFST
jgi:hypothetical protein